MKNLYIGLMSGTSMDGIDAGLFEFEERHCRTVAVMSVEYPGELRSALLEASRHPGGCGLDTLGRLDHEVGECFMRAAVQLIEQSGIGRQRIRAIGSHGQTLRHQPRAERPFTLQIGDPNIIAAGSGLTTVADFRRRDLALGGEGAPLATAFHHWFLSSADECRVVLNIGGIANVTLLPTHGGTVLGFDTGPGNTLLDAWIRACKGQACDNNGDWGKSGRTSPALLEHFLADPFFAQPPPKSTGFEHFNLDWLRERISRVATAIGDADVQATLAELTARSIAAAVAHYAPETDRVLVCGGGVHNSLLMTLLEEQLAGAAVESTAAYGIDPQWVEAATFAWLAKRCLDREPGNLPSVTGASEAAILGAVYFAMPGTEH